MPFVIVGEINPERPAAPRDPGRLGGVRDPPHVPSPQWPSVIQSDTGYSVITRKPRLIIERFTMRWTSQMTLFLQHIMI